MPFSIVADDLTRVEADAVVVAANTDLVIDGGVGYAVARAAGIRRMRRACEALAPCPVGEAVVTSGFRLSAAHVVHAVAPVWRGGSLGEVELLQRAYSSALRTAAAVGARSIALPLLGAGTYGVPVEVSLAAARATVREFLDSFDDLDVTLVVYSKEAIQAAAVECEGVRDFIAEVAELEEQRSDRRLSAFSSSLPCSSEDVSCDSPKVLPCAAPMPCAAPASRESVGSREPSPSRFGLPRFLRGRGSDASEECVGGLSFEEPVSSVASFEDASCDFAASSAADMDLDELLDSLDESFSTTLLALIDARGLTDAQVYKRANMSRQLFSKIRSDAAYQPTKRTALSLAIALELSMQETRDLLARAGFALSRSNRFDVIMEYFISRGSYDIFTINETLFQFDQPLLGGRG